MRHALIIAFCALPLAAVAQDGPQPKPDLLLESWRAYAMALEGLTENQLRDELISAHYDYLGRLDGCHEGMAHPSCADRETAAEIARLRRVTNGTLPDMGAIGPIVMECPGLPADATLTLVWGEPQFAVIEAGETIRVLEGIGGEDGHFAGQNATGEDRMIWTGTEAEVSLDGAPAVTCNVMIGED